MNRILPIIGGIAGFVVALIATAGGDGGFYEKQFTGGVAAAIGAGAGAILAAVLRRKT